MKKGFTLMELLGVIAIIGILMGISIPIGMSIIRSTNENTFNKEIRILEEAAKLYGRNNYNELEEIYGICDQNNIGDNCKCNEDGTCYYEYETNVKTLVESGEYKGYRSTEECKLYNEEEEKCYDCMKVRIKVYTNTKQVETEAIKTDEECEIEKLEKIPKIEYTIVKGEINKKNWVQGGNIEVKPVVTDGRNSKYCVSHDGKECEPNKELNQENITIKEEGPNIICVSTKYERSGEEREVKTCSEPYKIDKIAPTCELIGNAGNENDWTIERVITLKCNDKESGCIEGKKELIYNENREKVNISYTFKDNAGNEVKCEYTDVLVNVDSTPPVCGETIGAKNDKSECSSGSLTTKTKCSDNLSGCVYESFNQTYINYTADEGYTIIRDRAGNTTRCNYNIYLDNTAPIIDVEKSKAILLGVIPLVELHIKNTGCFDVVRNQHGYIKNSEYAYYITQKNYAPSFNATDDDQDDRTSSKTSEDKIYVRVKDETGNQSEITKIPLTIGATSPNAVKNGDNNIQCDLLTEMKVNSEKHASYQLIQGCTIGTGNLMYCNSELSNTLFKLGFRVEQRDSTVQFWHQVKSSTYCTLLYPVNGTYPTNYERLNGKCNYYSNNCE